MDAVGHLLLYTPGTSTPIGGTTGTAIYGDGNWHWIDFYYKAAGASSRFQLKVDGVDDIHSAGSYITGSFQPNGASQGFIEFAGKPVNHNVSYDDLIVYDTTGAANNTWVGDHGVVTAQPTATGATNEWEPDPDAFTTGVTKWYFPRTDYRPSDITPTKSALWESSAAWDAFTPEFRRGELGVKAGRQYEYNGTHPSANTDSKTLQDITRTTVANDDVMLVQYISPPLVAKTWNGVTFKCYARMAENSAGNDIRSQIVIRLVSEDGLTERAVLYGGDTATAGANPTSEWSTTVTNRAFPRAGLLPAALDNYTSVDGDRLVVELGFRSHTASSTDLSTSISVTDGQALDLPEDETTTAVENPWISFSSAVKVAQRGNWQYMDDTRPEATVVNSWRQWTDGDFTFVSTSADDKIDLYNVRDVDSSLAVDGPIAVTITHRKTDPGPRKIAVLYKTSGATQTGADQRVSTNYGTSKVYADVDGTDSAAWSNAKVNSLQIGQKSRP